MIRWSVTTLTKNFMELSPLSKVFLGSTLIAFGVSVLADFSLTKAALYIGAVLLSVVFFL